MKLRDARRVGLVAERLDRDLVCTGVEMLTELGHDRLGIAVRDEGVDQTIRATVSNVVLGEAHPHQVALVVLDLEIPANCAAGTLARLAGIGLDDDLVLGDQQRVGPEDLAGASGVLDGDEIRVRTK